MTQRLLATLSLLGLITALPVCSAMAQGSPALGDHVLPSTYKPKGDEPLPPGVPGARTATAPAAEPSKAVSDMSPNDALFDAINRGDLAGARDALSRGAMLSATNVLGMTPLDLSVDLGRDDITTVLLSMRGADPTMRGKPVETAAAKSPPPKRAARAPKVKAAAKPQEIAKVTPSPVRYAQDPGTPDPNAGFLGFGAR